MLEITLYTSKTCAPCHILSPRIKQLADSNPDKLSYIDVDITTDNPLNIMGTPHIVIKREGQEIINEHVSNPAQTLNKIKEMIP